MAQVFPTKGNLIATKKSLELAKTGFELMDRKRNILIRETMMMIDTAKELKKRHAGRIFVVSTFGLFTNGLASFDKAYEEGLIYRVVTTNLIYQTPELLSREYYISCDMSKYIAYIIDTLNHDASISDLLNPYDRIQNYITKYKEEQKAAQK